MDAAGKLDRRVTLQRYSVSFDALNQPVETWAELATVWASKEDVSDGERVRAEQVGSTLTTRFRIRHSAEVSGLNTKDRVVFRGLVFDIVGVKEIGRNDGLEITAAARSDLGVTP